MSVTSLIGDILFVSRLSNYVYPPSDGDIVYIQSIHRKSLYMLLILYFKWNSSKLCILAHYHMTIGLLLQQLNQTIFEGVISLFHLEYFIKNFFTHNFCYISTDIYSNLCMFAYYHMKICISLLQFD